MLEPAVAQRLATNGQRIIITGASGWLGLATLDLLQQALGNDFMRRVVCFGSAARPLTLRHGGKVMQLPLPELGLLPPGSSMLLHFAFLTKDRAEQMSEGEYRSANAAISECVLAALDPIDVRSIFVASSGAATKVEDLTASPAMRLYGALKQADEARFAQWATSTGHRAVVARLFNVSGPYINKHQAYALANFIGDAQAGRKIAVKAPREVIRSFVGIRELMSLSFALLNEAPDGIVRFDSGGIPQELGEVAQIVSATLGGPGVDRAAITEPVADRYCGDGAAYAGLLRRYGIASLPLPQQIIETAEYMASQSG